MIVESKQKNFFILLALVVILLILGFLIVKMNTYKKEKPFEFIAGGDIEKAECFERCDSLTKELNLYKNKLK